MKIKLDIEPEMFYLIERDAEKRRILIAQIIHDLLYDNYRELLNK